MLDLFKSKNKKKNKNKNIEDSSYSISGKQFHVTEMGLNDVINYAIDGFTSIKGRLENEGYYNVNGDIYLSTYCLKGASKCVLNFSDLNKVFKARFGNYAIGWNDAASGFDSLYAMIKNEKLIWGKTQEGYGFNNESGKMAEFSVDMNNADADKYKDIQIRIETVYLNKNEYQLILSVKNTR